MPIENVGSRYDSSITLVYFKVCRPRRDHAQHVKIFLDNAGTSTLKGRRKKKGFIVMVLVSIAKCLGQLSVIIALFIRENGVSYVTKSVGAEASRPTLRTV
jgi:hypothetical protein